MQVREPARLTDLVASYLKIAVEESQDLLATIDVRARLEKLIVILGREIELLELGHKIQSQVQTELNKNQREYYLRQQLKAIQKELGEGDARSSEIEDLEKKIEAAKMPEEARKAADKELERLQDDSARIGRAYRRAHLPRLAGEPAVGGLDRRQPRHQARPRGARRGPLRSRKGQGAHPRIPRRAQAQERHQGADPVLRRPAGHRQDLARTLDRASAGAQVRAPVARRHPRRGRDSRPSPHLHRLAARPHRSRGCATPAPTIRCSSSTRSTSSARTSAATRPRRCSKCSTPSRTTPSSTIISTCRSISPRCCS